MSTAEAAKPVDFVQPNQMTCNVSQFINERSSTGNFEDPSNLHSDGVLTAREPANTTREM